LIYLFELSRLQKYMHYLPRQIMMRLYYP